MFDMLDEDDNLGLDDIDMEDVTEPEEAPAPKAPAKRTRKAPAKPAPVVEDDLDDLDPVADEDDLYADLGDEDL
jgi:hypothetical protein